jgi:hypothetical protein
MNVRPLGTCNSGLLSWSNVVTCGRVIAICKTLEYQLMCDLGFVSFLPFNAIC